MQAYPYTIDNGSGEELTFLGVVRNHDGDRLQAASRAQPGAGPPMHVHAPEPVLSAHAGTAPSMNAV